MKLNLLTKSILGLSIATSTIAFLPKSSHAKAIFACDTTNMATTVETGKGVVPIIEWQDRSFIASVTPQQRCQDASEKLQQLYNDGEIKYIKT
ncbi:MAG: COP23 domain-containing protein, partial [Pleurocapsa sp.]